jgi:hypothetical protein
LTPDPPTIATDPPVSVMLIVEPAVIEIVPTVPSESPVFRYNGPEEDPAVDVEPDKIDTEPESDATLFDD